MDVHYYEPVGKALSEELNDPNCTDLIIDMSRIQYVDSSGLLPRVWSRTDHQIR
ncbi:MAG: hypothetical protein H7145_03295 [Akkermansiaceae bacterium]|nr:hypothetical protein [Armatimonadota bacterium]